jgi:DNA topoisomerase-2
VHAPAGMSAYVGQKEKEKEKEKEKDKDDDAIDMVFNKKRSDDRKQWLEQYQRNSYLDTNQNRVSYCDFVNKELIHFSKYDCDRSIPNLMDGLKISLRKILYASFKKNLTSEIKVAQFSGYVSEHSGYHHGEASLNAAIVGMAQNFVGSNNINLFIPNGQFGTRLQGGKDSASERYIFTQLNRLTRCLFPMKDDAILDYLDDDGLLVEPIFYAPIVPMILVNGTKGIGTGFSTDIMCYHPQVIFQYLKDKLENRSTNHIEFVPYYEGFQGTIEKVGPTKYCIRGKYEKLGGDKIRVTELPVGYWTDDFKEYLETLLDGVDKNGKKVSPVIRDYDDMSKDTTVDFIITFAKGKIEELEKIDTEYGCNGLEKFLKLYTTFSNSNMHLFDANDKLKKYETVGEIIDDYFVTRLKLYIKRKAFLLDTLKKELRILSNKARYIDETLQGTIDLRKKRSEEIHQLLEEKGYNVSEDDGSYKYLTKLPMDSVVQENVDKLKQEHVAKQIEYKEVEGTTVEKMWLQELDALEVEYAKYKQEREREQNGGNSEKIKKKVITKTKKQVISETV